MPILAGLLDDEFPLKSEWMSQVVSTAGEVPVRGFYEFFLDARLKKNYSIR